VKRVHNNSHNNGDISSFPAHSTKSSTFHIGKTWLRCLGTQCL